MTEVGQRVRLKQFSTQPERTFRSHPSNPGVRPADNGEYYQDDNLLVPPGTEGTVTELSPQKYGPDQVAVKWDNGSSLMLLADVDEWEELSHG